jgi:transposase
VPLAHFRFTPTNQTSTVYEYTPSKVLYSINCSANQWRVIQALEGGLIMRYDLTDFEWSAIEPVLPEGRRGRQPQNNRRVMNGVFWVLRTGAPWRDLPERYGPYTTAYNRFNRWRKAGIWDRLMAAVTKVQSSSPRRLRAAISCVFSARASLARQSATRPSPIAPPRFQLAAAQLAIIPFAKPLCGPQGHAIPL